MPRIGRELKDPDFHGWSRMPPAGLGRLRGLKPPPIHCYKKGNPGELLQTGIKKLRRIVRGQHRIQEDRRHRAWGVGWDILHVRVEDASWVGCVQILDE